MERATMETQTMTAGAKAPAKRAAKAKTAPKPVKKSAKAPDPAKKAAAEEAAKVAAAKKAEAEKAKGEAQAETLKTLKPIAKEIVTRLEKAEKEEQLASDHRVAAALRLAEAEKSCKEVGLNFKKWWEENGEKLSYETVRKLVTAGASGDPQKAALAIEDMRAKNAAANRKSRTKKKATNGAGTPIPGKAEPKMTPFKAADLALQALPEEVSLELIKGRAAKLGMAVVSRTEASRDTAAVPYPTLKLDKGKKTSSDFKTVCACFDVLNTDAKFEVIQHIEKQLGGKFKSAL